MKILYCQRKEFSTIKQAVVEVFRVFKIYIRVKDSVLPIRKEFSITKQDVLEVFRVFKGVSKIQVLVLRFCIGSKDSILNNQTGCIGSYSCFQGCFQDSRDILMKFLHNEVSVLSVRKIPMKT